MTDVRMSNWRITIVRYVVGVGSAVGFAWSMWLATPFPTSEVIEEYWTIFGVVAVTDFLSTSFGGPLGYLLSAEFCLRRWTGVMHREGLQACKIVLAGVMLVGTVGVLVVYVNWSFSPGTLLTSLTPRFGFGMLCGFALASGLRKLRRMMREANAE